MAKLNWKQSRGSSREREALASRAVRGKYCIINRGNDFGFLVKYRPPANEKKLQWWGREIGIVATEGEALALAQADNDRRLAETLQQQSA